jgi:hypothetical protein
MTMMEVSTRMLLIYMMHKQQHQTTKRSYKILIRQEWRTHQSKNWRHEGATRAIGREGSEGNGRKRDIVSEGEGRGVWGGG